MVKTIKEFGTEIQDELQGNTNVKVYDVSLNFEYYITKDMFKFKFASNSHKIYYTPIFGEQEEGKPTVVFEFATLPKGYPHSLKVIFPEISKYIHVTNIDVVTDLNDDTTRLIGTEGNFIKLKHIIKKTLFDLYFNMKMMKGEELYIDWIRT